MDFEYRRGLIETLCSFDGRTAGTDAERRAANWLAGALAEPGRAVAVEPTHVRPDQSLVISLHALLAVVGGVVAVAVPVAGFAIILFTAASLYLDQGGRLFLLRRVFFRRASQNVVSRPRGIGGRGGSGGQGGAAKPVVVLSAHYDSPRTGLAFGPRPVARARRLSPRMRLFFAPVRLIFWLGIVPLLLISGARMAGAQGDWLSTIQLIPTAILLLGIAPLIDIHLSPPSPGACDNASGVAAVISAARGLKADPIGNIDLWVLLTGAEESGSEGMAAFVRSHRAELADRRAAFINLDSVGFGRIHCVTGEGPVATTALDRGLIELCEQIATDRDLELGKVRIPMRTDAVAAQVRGFSAISLIGADDGVGSPLAHTLGDLPGTIDHITLDAATALVVDLVRALDAKVTRSADQL